MKYYEITNNLLRPGFLIIGAIILSFALIQCKTKVIITGKDDFYLIDELKKFEYDYSLHEGIKYKLLGDFKRSFYFFERCIEIFPYSDLAYYELANIYYIAQEFDKAIEYNNKAIEIEPNIIWYYYQLGRIHQGNDDIESAILVFTEASDKFVDNNDLLFTLGGLLSKNKNFDEALDIYKEIEGRIGIDERICLSRKYIYMNQGEFEKAYREIKRLIYNFPQEPRYYGILAELYTSVDMYDEALDSYQKLFKIEPDNGQAQLSVAKFYLHKGNFNEAFNYMEIAFDNQKLEFHSKLQFFASIAYDRYLINNFGGKIQQLGELLIEKYPDALMAKAVMSEFYITTEEYEEAFNLLHELYNHDPGNIDFAEQLIGVLSYKAEYERVIQIGKEIINKFSESVIIHYYLGNAYHITGKDELAIEIFESALKLDDVNKEMKSNFYTILGDLFHKRKNYIKSDICFDNALKIDSNNMIALNNYAYYLALREERLTTAKKYSLKTIENEPDNVSYLDTYAWILYKKGKYGEALKFIKRAYESGGYNNFEIVKHFGEILLKLEEYEKAKYYFTLARELNDDKNELDKIIIYLEERCRKN